jgi:hypothetical protein
MASLTDAAESRVLNFITGNSGATAPTTPLKLKLMTANGDDSSAGTEVAGGSYSGPSITPSASSAGGASTNGSDIVITGMPACTVVGWEIWDSAGTPFRWMHDTMTSKTVNSGDDFKIPAGSLSLTAD